MSQPWLRLYRSALNNAKLQRLGLEAVGFWTNLLLMTDDNGTVTALRNTVTDIAWQMRITEADCERLLNTLVTAGLVTHEADGSISMHDWDVHQKRTDKPNYDAEKQRRYRENKALRNSVTVALPESYVLDTDTDTDKKEEKNMSVPSAPDDFESFWKAYPRTPNMSKPGALKAWKKQKSKLPPQEILLQAVAKYRAFLAAETKKNGKEYPAKHAQGWLNEERWLGFIGDVPSIDAPKHSADWADEVPEWARFKASVQPAAWSAFFAGCRPNGSISTLIAPSTFVMEQIESRYGQALDAIFDGQFNVKFEART